MHICKMDAQKDYGTGRYFEIAVHIVGWGLLFAFPFFFMLNRNGDAIDWMAYLRHCLVPFSFCILFYLNYFVLIPRFYFSDNRKKYIGINLLLVVVFCVAFQYLQSLFSPPRGKHPADTVWLINPIWIFLLRDFFSMVLTIVMAVAVKVMKRLNEAEVARRNAEKSLTEAELKNLRNQINPHFLLNTLNNIYALIAFDTDKAQMAVQELSRLLRHVLYDNQQTYVSLGKEMDFIQNYIALMRMRIASNVDIETKINIHPDSQTPIAPLIFISLIENAFKHGVSPTGRSHITISFVEQADTVVCETRNSFHPKGVSDKSGSGIGLEQVHKRLELLYPGKYSWQYGVNEAGTEYVSRLEIKTQLF